MTFLVGGYDESFLGIGFQDNDLMFMFRKNNILEIVNNKGVKQTLQNSKEQTIKYVENINNISYNKMNEFNTNLSIKKKIKKNNVNGFCKFKGILNFDGEIII